MKKWLTKPKPRCMLAPDEAEAVLVATEKACEAFVADAFNLAALLKKIKVYHLYLQRGFASFRDYCNQDLTKYDRSYEWARNQIRLLDVTLLENEEKTRLAIAPRPIDASVKFNTQPVRLSDVQKQVILKLPPKVQKEAVRVVMKECPGATPEHTKEVIRRTVKIPGKPSKPLPKGLEESPIEDLRTVLLSVGNYFTGMSKLGDTELARAASSVFEYCRKVSKAAKKI